MGSHDLVGGAGDEDLGGRRGLADAVVLGDEVLPPGDPVQLGAQVVGQALAVLDLLELVGLPHTTRAGRPSEASRSETARVSATSSADIWRIRPRAAPWVTYEPQCTPIDSRARCWSSCPRRSSCTKEGYISTFGSSASPGARRCMTLTLGIGHES